MFAKLFWLGLENIDHCSQLSSSDTLEKDADLHASVITSVILMSKVLYICILFLVEFNILFSILPFLLTIIV